MEHIVFLGLGSNLGERAPNLRTAIKALPPHVEVVQASPVYQTAPWGYTEQADFLNQVVKAQTNLSPQALLVHLKNIENKIGRTATFRWGPREIDIDILLYDDLIVDEPGLTIPHPRLHQRAFMLVPLAHIDGEIRLPGSGKTIDQLLSDLDTASVEIYQETP